MGVAEGGPAPREPVPLRRNRDFQLLWGGQAVSLLGSQTSKIAYPLLVLALTGSPAKAGIAGFFAAAVNILLQILTLGLIVLARHDGASSAQIGLIVGCMGVGGLVGAFAAPWFQRRIPAGSLSPAACGSGRSCWP